MATNTMLSKKAALRVLENFWSSIEEDRFEVQVLDCMAVILNYVPSMLQDFHEEYLEFCKRQQFYRVPARTAFGRQFFNACVKLGLIDPAKIHQQE